MRTFTVDHPSNCPWRMSTECTYRNGGYINGVKCGPHLKDFPKDCPMDSCKNNKPLGSAQKLMKKFYPKGFPECET